MTEKNTKPLKLVLHAMDSRAVKAMIMFLQVLCKGVAVVVNSEDDADINVFDADVPASKRLLERHLEAPLAKPVLVLALEKFPHEGVLFVKKPALTNEMIMALEQAKTLAVMLTQKATESSPAISNSENKDTDLFKDDFFEYLSMSTWADDTAEITAPEILKVVKAPELQPVTVYEPEADEAETQEPEATSEAEMLTQDQESPENPPGDQDVISGHPASGDTASTEIAGLVPVDPAVKIPKTVIINRGLDKTSKHQAARFLDDMGSSEYIDPIEQDFDAFVGAIDNLFGTNDQKKQTYDDYNPNEYFQGYFQYVLTASLEKKQPVMLHSDWCPIALFPYTQEVWLEAGDSELKAFAEIRLKHKTIASDFSAELLDPKTMNLGGSASKFQNMDAFLWKLACWTSKGRYPQDIDCSLPVYLKHWPNFTRLMLTPHALRIAALLHSGPRTMTNIAETLNIKPQYVFVFISAAYALGLAGQARRLADNLVQPPVVTPSKGQDLLGRILGKIRN